MTTSVIALYWDFENLHAALLEERDGPGAYQASKFRPQDPVVEIQPVLAYAESLGRVTVNRAYGNWQWLARYRHDLQAHGLDLVQLFPLGTGAKNGADIRLAVDAVDDLHRFPRVTHVVVVGGDSDYLGLAQRVRQHGRRIVGVGAEGSSHRQWVAACDTFVRYRDLVAVNLGSVRTASERAAAFDLAVDAVDRLAAETGRRWVVKAAVKPMMTRIEPTFDETNLGFGSFNAFLVAVGGRLVERVGEFDHEIAVEAEHATIDLTQARPVEDRYDRVLRRANIRLPERAVFWAAVEAFEELAGGGVVAASFQHLETDTVRRLTEAGFEVDDRQVRSARQVLFKLKMFALLGEDVGVCLVAVGADLGAAVRTELLRTVATSGVGLDDHAGLATTLYGPEPTAERVASVVASCQAVLAGEKVSIINRTSGPNG